MSGGAPEPGPDPALAARRWALAFGSAALTLAAVLIGLLVHQAGRDDGRPQVLTGSRHPRAEGEALDAGLQAAIDAMVAEAKGIMDSHPDPDVGRVLQPRLSGVEFRGAVVSTNDDGLREGTITRPKPPGVLRVVLLGDSYVFGWGVDANRRVGRLLQQHLRRELPGREVEVLTVAVPSWNLRAQCAYLRRQAALLQADLVVVHLCDNDLDDDLAVRGFGSVASFSSQQRARGDALVWRNYPVAELLAERSNPLLLGLDHASRARWRRAVDDVRRLRDAVAAAGGRTWLLMNMGVHTAVARERFVDALGDVPAVWVPPRFASDPENLVHPRDVHWSELGHGRVADLLYGALQTWQPFDGVELPARDAAGKAWQQLQRTGEFQAGRAPEPDALWPMERALAALVPQPGGGWPGATQVYGGVDLAGRLGAYACVVLAPGDDGAELVLELGGLGRSDLPRVTLQVRVDGQDVGELSVAADETARARFDLPAAPDGLLFAVELQADDWVHAPDDLRHAVAARLLRVAVE